MMVGGAAMGQRDVTAVGPHLRFPGPALGQGPKMYILGVLCASASVSPHGAF